MKFSKILPNRNKIVFFSLFGIMGLIILGFNQIGATAAPADSIVGYVWQDLNANGIQDVGEPGMGNVTVNLLDGGGAPLSSTTTFPTGDYIFTSLTTPGNYIIEFEIPSGSGLVFSPPGQGGDPLKDSDADVGTGRTSVIALGAGEGRDGIDAGMHPPTSIGDRVWNDLNVNGIQDGGEPGLGGVDVELYASGGGISGTTTSIFNGAYSFSGIPPGQYYVKFLLPAGFSFSPQNQGVDTIDSDADVVTGETAVFTATVGTNKDDIDAGLFQPASIGDRVWEDLNGDGIQNGGELGMSGLITVTLYDTTDAVIDITNTDATGIYTFTNLIPDIYYLDFDIPDGYIASPQDQGGDDALDSDIDTEGRTANVTVAFAEEQQDIDAGFAGNGSIGDFVWNDLDGDGGQDGGEPGLAGVTVYLDLNNNGTLDGEPNDVTDGAGAYDFTSLVAGTYTVTVDSATVPAGYALTTGNDPLTVNLAASEDYDDADFGYQQQTASIGDFVWNDLDGDGVQDGGEVGIDGVTLNLIDDLNSNGSIDIGEPVISSTTTVGGGDYNFINLAIGDYIVDVTGGVPAGFILTGGIDPQAATITVVGENYTNADFGYQQQDASIGDLVWNDLDGDTLPAGEPGLVGVTVYLDLNNNGALDGGEPNDITDGAGAYDITGLAAGTYTVTVDITTVPVGYALTTANDPLPVNLTVGEDYDDADFGFWDPGVASIGDFVWNDLNGDGGQDGGEPGLSGVTVYLDLNNNGALDGEPNDTTDGAGAYDITGLVAGTYTVTVDSSTVPVGFVLTTGNDPLTVNLAASEDYNDADFGYQEQTASIGDFVWNDLDGDGVQDGGEGGIDGVTLNLIDDLNSNGSIDIGEPVISSTTTVGGGDYNFINLAIGDYIVDVTGGVPAGFILTGGIDPQAATITVVGENYTNADFGYQQQDASIGDLVWNDLDGDTLPAGELGLVGVTVYLDLNNNGAFDGGEPNDITDGAGAYDITGLAAGIYTVTVDSGTVPVGFVLTTMNDPLNITIAAGDSYVDADFGFQDPGTASIGDFVWNDLNGDGVQDIGEPGIDSVTVDLIDDLNSNGSIDGGEPVISTTTTAGGGFYDFPSLVGGYYIVNVDETSAPLAGFSLTTANDPLAINLAATQDYNDADFGYADPSDASIGDFVWNDRNNNGMLDAGEPGMDGITVDLTGFGPDDTFGTVDDVVYTAQVTAGGGAYDFTGLPAGMYRVDVDDTTLPGGVSLTGGTDPFNMTLGVSEDYNSADFGYQGTASIGDLVWADDNANGTQDGGEVGLAAVTIYLDLNGSNSRENDEPFGTTNGTGDYAITGLPAGSYAVEVDDSTAPAGYTLNTTTPMPVTLTAGETFVDADFAYVEGFEVYLPVILNNFEMVVAPDLVVTSVSATNDEVQVVIENQGNIATGAGFWVDFYVAPSPVPIAANELWQDVAPEGIAWGITIPIAAGDSLTLTYSTAPGAPNLYYSATDSNFTGTMIVGTSVYAQVDSAHVTNVNGAILETHEISGDPYNNVSNEVFSTAGASPVVGVTSSDLQSINAIFDLPLR